MVCIVDLCVADFAQDDLDELEQLFKVLPSHDFYDSVTHETSTAPTGAMNSQHP